MKNFITGRRIAYLRSRNIPEMTQKELAKLIYASRTTISALENGERRLKESVIKELSDVFEVPDAYFRSNPYCKDLEIELEIAFEKLFTLEVVSTDDIFMNNRYDLEIGQEVAFRLLQAIYFYKKNDFEKGDCIAYHFVAKFNIDENEIKNNATLFKYFIFFKYELSFRESNLNACHHYAKQLLELVDSQKQKSVARVFLAQALFLKGSVEEAYSVMEVAVETIETFDEGFLLASAFINLSSILIYLNFCDRALEVLQKVERMTHKLENDDLKSLLLYQRGEMCRKRKEYEEALSYYERAYDLATDLSTQIKILDAMAICSVIKDTGHEEILDKLKKLKRKNLRKYDKMKLTFLKYCLQHHNYRSKSCERRMKGFVAYFDVNGYRLDLEYVYYYLAYYYRGNGMYKTAMLYFMKQEENEASGNENNLNKELLSSIVQKIKFLGNFF